MDEADDDPLWKRILTNELLWTAVVAAVILALALWLATGRG